ncbi:transporter [Lactobacillus delbrueckii]|uniref:transporter n=2 Tax=Lactobacillus delbrueckii TaxID=1584 RepID=UPI001022A87F|nr:transporter [Lactobacillus delbrueckii]
MTPNLTAFTGVDSQNLPDVMVSVQFILAIGEFILAIGGSKISKKVYAAILATGLMSFSGVLVETAMNVAFPTLMKQFGLATNTVQWMNSIYLLFISVIVPLSAVLKSSFKTKQLSLLPPICSSLPAYCWTP